MKTYFIDTNYLLRLFIGTSNPQFPTVYALFENAAEGKVRLVTSVIVFFEFYWVLSSFYKQNKPACVGFLYRMLKMDFLEIHEKDMVFTAVELFAKTSLELEDCFNIVFAKKLGKAEFATFDKKILKQWKR